MVTRAGIDRLLAAIDADPPRLGPEEYRDVAAGALAPLLCRRLAEAAVPESSVAAALDGLSRQRSLLALMEATDELLGSPSFVTTHGARLHLAMLAGHTAAIGNSPLVAAAFAEGALRLAVAGVGNALRTLFILTPDQVGDLDPGYAGRLPRLLGVALDRWGLDPTIAEPLRATLTALRDEPGAAYEYGLDQLRAATAAGADGVGAVLLAARASFADAEAAGEDDVDAALYGAGLDAVLAFFHGDTAGIRAARVTVGELLGRHVMALRNSHVPAWRRPRIEATYAWSRLVAVLDEAGTELAQDVWLNAWTSLDTVLEAYTLDRAVVPVAGLVDPDGFPRLVRPVIETGLSRRWMLIAQLRRAAGQEQATPHLRLLLDRIGELATGAEPATPGAEVQQRLRTAAPCLTAELGPPLAAFVAGGLEATPLKAVEQVALRDAQQRAWLREPATVRLLEQETGDATVIDRSARPAGAFTYVVAVSIQDFAARTNPERMQLRSDLYRILATAFQEARLDWDTIEQLDRGAGVVLLAPPGTDAVALGGPFLRELAACLTEQARHYRLRLKLRVAVAQGLCHRDEHGWLGEPIEEATRLAARDTGTTTLACIVSSGFYDTVIRHGYRRTDRDEFVALPGTDRAFMLAGDPAPGSTRVPVPP
ncbi:hypothetical protein [Actinoplanes sp. NPDC051494]|uniref:hypothetical protein n=1 Tax=Actinoplanes sp. NPDC051494 TaxID=3363907 RepID=UPI0037932525